MGKKVFEKQAADDKANLESKIPAKRARLGYDKPRWGAKWNSLRRTQRRPAGWHFGTAAVILSGIFPYISHYGHYI